MSSMHAYHQRGLALPSLTLACRCANRCQAAPLPTQVPPHQTREAKQQRAQQLAITTLPQTPVVLTLFEHAVRKLLYAHEHSNSIQRVK